ncbi:macro domain-containing protein [Kribbella sp.]|uniref:macro domain-containing protein n=1 Tax=Kribbella sp. TaxID=1871183 RepID=UPI002D5A1308|nr:macro domain-containing protein [Kribbella sp.]HZX03531.1 macro domain-containing protein [Kribbella sp.]
MTDATAPRLLLVDLDAELVAAWREAFAAQIADGTVDVRHGSLLDVLPEVDAVLTAGNSYGQMDGGVDRALSDHWPSVQRSVWTAIAEEFHGYQPVGTATLVPTGGDPCRWLVYAPTMRVPMRLTGGLDIAVHDAFWAALLAISNHAAPITTIAAPGFGTGFGRVPAARAAQLMSAAHTLHRLPPTTPISQRERLF